MLIKVEAYPDSGGQVSKTIHACLATAYDDGCLFRLGRKDGDLTFAKDKSVSRQHCLVRLIGEGGMAPRNDEETKACRENDGYCLVLENSGKGGSYVAVADTPTLSSSNDNEDDSVTDDGDEETDDEGISQPLKSQKSVGAEDVPAQSEATKKEWGDTPVKLLKMDVGDHKILRIDHSSKTVMVQCGRFESTLRITRVSLRIGFSRVKGSTSKVLISKLHMVGAVEDEYPAAATNYLVTSERSGHAKQLIAWCYNVPMVTPSYLEALLERKMPSDPMPSVEDHGLKSVDKHEFWDETPNPKLLSEYTLLSVESNEIEKLAVAAGAKLVSLYELASEAKAAKRAEELIQSDLCFVLASRKRLTKKLTSLGIPSVSAKKMASAVSKQARQLVDEKGNVICKGNDREEEDSISVAVDDNTSTRVSPTRQNPKEKRKYDTNEESFEMQTKKKRTSAEVEEKCNRNPATQPGSPSTSHEKAKKSMVASVADHHEVMQVESLDDTENEESKLEKAPISTNIEPTVATSLTRRARQSTSTHLKAADSNGWFITAPKEDSKRKEWRRLALKESAVENGGMQFLPPAQTERITLVTPPPIEKKTPFSRRRRDGPNFKQFRKNLVYRVEASARISLRIFVPGQSEQQRMMEQDQRELEEEQRRADELFRGDGAVAGKRRRRRA